MKSVSRFVSFLLFSLAFLVVVTPSYAADIRTGETVTVSTNSATNKPLTNLYLFGKTIYQTASVNHDVVAAGSIVNLEGPVSGDIITAGKTIEVTSPVGNTIIAAGQDIVIRGNVTNDLIVAASNVVIDKSASIGGDVFFAGKALIINGTVGGNVKFTGSEVLVNNAVGSIQGETNQLTLGEMAKVKGDVQYTSAQKAEIAKGAYIGGQTKFEQKKEEPKENQKQLISGSDIYLLLIQIAISVLMIFFFGKQLAALLQLMRTNALSHGLFGLGFLLIFPGIALVLLLLLWLGFAAFLVYGFALIVATFVAKIFAGQYIMNWYEKRSKKVYTLDWKAGVVGPIALFVVGLIPVLGWILEACLFLVALGTLVTSGKNYLQGNKK